MGIELLGQLKSISKHCLVCYTKSQKIPGFYFQKSRDRDWRSIPGSRDIPGSRWSLLPSCCETFKTCESCAGTTVACKHRGKRALSCCRGMSKVFLATRGYNNQHTLAHPHNNSNSNINPNQNCTIHISDQSIYETNHSK